MDFFEAMQMMKDGRKVRVTSWEEDQFIGIMEQDIKVFGKNRKQYSVLTHDELALSPCVSFSALINCEWEEFKDLSLSLT